MCPPSLLPPFLILPPPSPPPSFPSPPSFFLPLLPPNFMAYVKKLLFKSNLNEEIGLWARYVDDILVIFNKINPKINDILLFFIKFIQILGFQLKMK